MAPYDLGDFLLRFLCHFRGLTCPTHVHMCVKSIVGLWIWHVAHSFLRIACQWAVCCLTRLPPILCEIGGCELLIKWVQAKMEIRYTWVGGEAQLLTGNRLHHVPSEVAFLNTLEGRSWSKIQANYSLMKLPSGVLKTSVEVVRVIVDLVANGWFKALACNILSKSCNGR